MAKKKKEENKQPNVKVLPEWNDIKDKIGSISAMARDLGMPPLTFGDASHIFRTNNHRKLFEDWLENEKAKIDAVNQPDTGVDTNE